MLHLHVHRQTRRLLQNLAGALYLLTFLLVLALLWVLLRAGTA